ncbi:cytochrome c oxidase assembly protein CtaG/Cox11-domain-containing protein [Scenedesmus sp. NREL 46B-D3]|nr:cytochrome c oxidase assembly protein CtaG/Cox11-domain-containing protein [Scenedesmus sp. NREL 46B-D3]
MLRQLTRLGHRAAAAASQHHQLLDPLQQAPLWSDVLRASQQAPLWQRAACGYCQAAAGAAAAPRRVLAAPGQQQQAWRAYQSGYDQARNKNKKGIVDGSMYLGAVVLGMIGFSYASVPLYRAFCQATGYGGAVGKAHNIEAKLQAREAQPNPTLEEKCAKREIRVWFSSDVADDMPWSFKPTQDYVTVHPGESTLAFFTAHNKSARAITGVSTYNVVPDKAAYYFNKVQCFCFEEQRLRGGEVVDMPVFFYLDPELVEDHNCRNVHDITLSYTFFKVDEDEADSQLADDSSSGVKLHGPAGLPGGMPAAGGPAGAAARVTAR